MGTKKALEKLNNNQLHYCTALSYIINRAKEKGLKADYEKTTGELSGFLECLRQMKTITNSEAKLLYLWFATSDRTEKNKGGIVNV